MVPQTTLRQRIINLSWLPTSTLALAVLTFALLVISRPGPNATSDFSIVWLTIGAVLIFGLHIWAANLDPVEHYVSEYSDVPGYGSCMRSAFFCLGIATFNLAYAYNRLVAHNPWLLSLLILAGIFTVGMGIFSMRTTTPGEIHTSALDGTIHNACATLSFSLAIATMLQFACWPPHLVVSEFQWLRAAALAQFNVAVVAALIYIILGIGKVKEIRKRTGLPLSWLIAADAKQTVLPASPVSPIPLEGAKGYEAVLKNNGNSDSVKLLNRGIGLVERILIFMFLEWQFILAFMLRYLADPTLTSIR